jgi:glucose-1-phosphate cytidylyltransferase
VGDIDIKGAINFHKEHGRLATLTAVQPGGRFGALQLKDSTEITAFHETPKGDGAWVNGGFFVLEPEAIDYIEGDSVCWEREPLERLSREGQLHAWRHDGFWQAVDTLRGKRLLNDIRNSGKAPWKLWRD